MFTTQNIGVLLILRAASFTKSRSCDSISTSRETIRWSCDQLMVWSVASWTASSLSFPRKSAGTSVALSFAFFPRDFRAIERPLAVQLQVVKIPYCSIFDINFRNRKSPWTGLKSRKESSKRRRNYSTEDHRELSKSALKEGKWRCDHKMAIFAYRLHEVGLWRNQLAEKFAVFLCQSSLCTTNRGTLENYLKCKWSDNFYPKICKFSGIVKVSLAAEALNVFKWPSNLTRSGQISHAMKLPFPIILKVWEADLHWKR